jgi:hypothetical protein
MKLSQRCSLVALAALTLGVTRPAHATTVVPPPPCPLLLGIGVSVIECPTSSSSGTYQVSNFTGQTIFSFGVSTSTGNASSVLGAPNGWSTTYYSEATWNSTVGPSLSLGNFDNTFGTTDTGLFFFSSAVGIANGTIATGFSYGAAPASDFIVLGANNVLISSSLPARVPTNAVPEPGSYAMLGLGLLGVGILSRRMRQSV